MNITPMQNNRQTNFGSLNLVQVKKTAFKNPEDLIGCTKVFDKSLAKVNKEFIAKLPMPVRIIMHLIGVSNPITRAIVDLESPLYPIIKKRCQKMGNNAPFWYESQFGIKVPEPLDKDYHSFWVLTKENKDDYNSFSKGKGNGQFKPQVKEALNKDYPLTKARQNIARLSDITNNLVLFTLLKGNEVAEKQIKTFNETTQNGVVNKFVINDLSEVPEMCKKIDF